MDIKNHRVTGDSVLLPNQERLVAAIKEAARSDQRVFKSIDGFEGRAFLRDCCKSVDTKMPGATKDLPAFKALRHCINKYSPRTYNQLKVGLESVLAKLDSEIEIAVGADFLPPFAPGLKIRATLATVIYDLGLLSDVCTLEDAYVYPGLEDNNSVEMSNTHLSRRATENLLSVKAIKPGNQVVIDYFKLVLSGLGRTEGMYLLITPAGERNEPSIQLMLAVPTGYGMCMRKLCLSFRNDYAELVNENPAPENVVALKKQY